MICILLISREIAYTAESPILRNLRASVIITLWLSRIYEFTPVKIEVEGSDIVYGEYPQSKEERAN